MARPDIVVMGASAGGVEALQFLMSELPAQLRASIFVVLHTGAQNGHLTEILNRNGNMRAVRAYNGLAVVRSQIFVAPPNQHLTLADGRMWLTVGPKINRHRPAIDPLFESAAEEYGARVIGVVLTGYLDDGSAGLAEIKRRGGLAIVQDPKDAVAPDMPRNALRVVHPDYCLPLRQIAPLLVSLVRGDKATNNRRT